MECPIQVQVTKRPWLPFGEFCLALSLTHSKGSQLPRSELPNGETHTARDWWCQKAGGSSSCQQPDEWDWSSSSSNRALRWNYNLGWQFDGSLVRPWGRGTHLSHSWIPDNRNHEINRFFCFKPLRFKINYCMTIKNEIHTQKHTIHTFISIPILYCKPWVHTHTSNSSSSPQD